MTEDDVATFERCMSVGGVALFPADTVYGLATDPGSGEGFERLCRIKGRSRNQPSAVMFFSLEYLLEALPEIGSRTRAALTRVLPGALTVVVPNPARRYRLACGTTPDLLGVRVPALDGGVAPLAAVRWPVLQSSANLHGQPETRRLEEVDARIRARVDLQLDGGELPGTPSTVVDLSRFEASGEYSLLREGAVPAAELAAALGST